MRVLKGIVREQGEGEKETYPELGNLFRVQENQLPKSKKIEIATRKSRNRRLKLATHFKIYLTNRMKFQTRSSDRPFRPKNFVRSARFLNDFSVKATVDRWESSNQRTRSREVMLTRMRIGHSRATHSYLFTGTDPPNCLCDKRLTVYHIPHLSPT